MKPSLEISRTIIPFGFRSEFETSSPSSPERVKALGRLLLEQCITRALIREGELQDTKGRDPNLVLIEGIPQKLKPNGHELLFLCGTTPVDILDNPDSDLKDSETTAWSFAVHTPFKEFEGAHHIRHGVLPKFDTFDRDQLLQAFESAQTKVSLLRFGFDLFKSQHFLAMIGFIPSSVRTVLIDANENELRFKIFADALGRREESPFTVMIEDRFWTTLCSALLQIYSLNAEDSYLRAMAKD